MAVAFLDEAISLRKQGITAPILVLGASRPKDVMTAIKYKVTLTVYYKDWLEEAVQFLNKEASLTIHLKLDTGMGRIGVRNEQEIQSIEELLVKHPNIVVEGIFTHFATADEKILLTLKAKFNALRNYYLILQSCPQLFTAVIVRQVFCILICNIMLCVWGFLCMD